MKGNPLRLIYIHGFQGDHTSFQAFPTDLHERIQARLPASIDLNSCLYPTYKSRRPISEAATKFIAWLSTQPPGPIILLAHSMGGLLAAEVAIADSGQSKRVIGLVAFDVPFSGMHPHVVVSGIASLLPGDKRDKEKTEAQLNNKNIVKIVRSDDVEGSNGISIDESSKGQGESQPLRLPLYHHSSSSFSSQLDDEWETMKTSVQPSEGYRQNNLSPYSSSTSSPSPSPSIVSSIASASTSYVFSQVPPLPSPLAARIERAAERITDQTNSPFFHWLRKHADDPLNAMTRWVVEHFEFGICMFDPVGLRDRYKALECWNGNWINFWTEVPARGPDTEQSAISDRDQAVEGMDVKGVLPSNTADLPRFTDIDEQASESDVQRHVKARKHAEEFLRKERARERTSARPARHFIVLPHTYHAISDSFHLGSRERWECVPILGVDDEVEAHCGLFIRSQNPKYDELVERVANVIEEWCGKEL